MLVIMMNNNDNTSNIGIVSSDIQCGRSARLPAYQLPEEQVREGGAHQVKKVRFQSEPAIIISACLPSEDMGMGEGSVPSLWYSRQELEQIRTREATFIKLNRRFCAFYVQAVGTLYDRVRQHGIADSLEMDSDDDSASTALSFICGSPARGLEREVLPYFRQRRKDVIQKYLAAQEKLRAKSKIPCYSREELQHHERALSLHYQKLARPAVRFARWTALGDANAASEDSDVQEEANTIDTPLSRRHAA